MLNLDTIKKELSLTGTTDSLLDQLAECTIITPDEKENILSKATSDEEKLIEIHRVLKEFYFCRCYRLYEVEGDRVAKYYNWKTYQIDLYTKGE